MRDLIDRQTVLDAIVKHIGIDGNKATLLDVDKLYIEVDFMPTVTRISDERYNRLIGKPIKQ